MTRLPIFTSGRGSLRPILSAAVFCGIVLLAGCGSKSDDTIKPPPPGPTATPDAKVVQPPVTEVKGTLGADK